MKGNLKRILTLALLAALLAASALPLPGLPPAARADGDFVIVNGELTEYNGPGGVVRIPHGVTAIGEGVFKNRDDITGVIIPKGVRTIGEDAFWGCTGLKRVVLPSTLLEISSRAFYGCERLPSIAIPKRVTVIGARAFANCFSLKKVTLPRGLEAIGEGVFNACRSLTRVTIPNTVTAIGAGAFQYCYSLQRVNIPKGVTGIESSTFYFCENLTAITIPDTVQGIGEDAFAHCRSLTSVTIGNGVTTVGEYAFMQCRSLTSIVIPDSVTTIAANAFSGCKNLRLLTLPAGLQEPPVFPSGDTQTTVIPDDLLPPMIVLKVGQSMALPRFKGARVRWRILDTSTAEARIIKNRTVRGVKAGAVPTTLIMKVDGAAQGKALTLNGQPLKPGKEYWIDLMVLGKGEPTARKVAIRPRKMTLHPLGYGYPTMVDLDLVLTPTTLPDFWFQKSNRCYTSSNPRVAQVLYDGTVYAIRPGKATIRVYIPNMKTASATVTVKGRVTSLRLKGEGGGYVKKLTLKKGDYYELTPELNWDAALKEVRWTSSNPVVAMVADNQIETMAPGRTVITATALDGSNKRASVVVTVTEP